MYQIFYCMYQNVPKSVHCMYDVPYNYTWLRCVERSDGAELESEKSEPQPVPGTPGVAGFPIPNPPYLRKRCCYWAAA